ncbi:MAG: glycosyltransferase family 2 protein [Bacteroidales bacterium]|nr:glycosyltransferase family 2 protein [Bacteroidales bacterium]
MIKISVVIITMNEERNIGRCLASVDGVADEIVILDSGSTDRTEELCKNAGARFYFQAFKGHIEQKNLALEKASHPYVLSLDADEALSDELKQSILETKQNWAFDGYIMNRLTNYCGTWIKHSAWYPDSKLRLFNREKGQWGGINPHDKFILEPKTKTAHLKGDLLHYSYYSIQEHSDRTEHYAEIAAQALYQQGKKVSFVHRYSSSLVKFLRTYFLYLGFLDGANGWIICKITAWGTYLKYKKLYDLNQ